MKIWVDDERPMPAGYDRQVTNAAEAIAILESCDVTAISLDHDLGEDGGTGYDVACYIEQAAYSGILAPLEVSIHSANPVGRLRMEEAIKQARSFWQAREHGDNIKVGIFWCVDDVIIYEAVSLGQAEPYGEALQHGGHYEFWERLRPLSVPERKLKSRSYDAWPRGRVVFFPARRVVRIYHDTCLDNDNLNDVLDLFEHRGYRIELEYDEHYRCATCNPNFLDEQ